jgi:tRNA G18 (ribose-2'-O)-methylase SpoU
MPGPADSLNVAVAAGVVLFEAARQRLLAHTESLQPSA